MKHRISVLATIVGFVTFLFFTLGTTFADAADVRENDNRSVSLLLLPENDSPTFTSSPPTAVNEDATYTYSIVVTDEVTDTVTLSAPTKPAWLTLTPTSNGTATLSGTPTNAHVGLHAVTLQAKDTANNITTQSFSIQVNNTNDPPTFASSPVTAVNEDTTYTYNIVVNDIDSGDTITISAPTLPTWLTLTPTGNGTATLSGIPTDSEVGPHSVTLQAKDVANSSATQSFTIHVSNVNDAPVLDNSGNMTLPNINEDNQTSNGDLVIAIIASAGGNRITDIDGSDALEGIAVIGTDSTNGLWQYSTNNGSSWSSFGIATDTAAILLNNFARIRFVPNLNYSGPAGNITFRAWDQTSGSNGSTGINASVNGGTTAFSVATETATLTVSAINDAPVLDNSGNMVLPNINEDALNPSGDTVANIILSAGLNRITDVDAGAVEGIAVTGINNTNGFWQYSTNNGSNWNNFSSVSDSAAVLLNPAAKIRFLPSLDYSGSAGNITFRAWDQTSGSNGSTGINTIPNGGATAFSLATETATLTVLPVNDLPVLDLNGPLDAGTGFETTFTANKGSVKIVDTDLSLTDVDHLNQEKATVTITNPWDGAAESLAATTSGTSISAAYNPTDSTLTLSGVDTISNYQKVLRTVTYNNTAQDPDDRQRSISFVVNDGVDDSLPVTALVNIIKPVIKLVMTPNTQTIGSGATAEFHIDLTNEGNVNLSQIETFSDIADCAKNYATLQVGETKSFTCVLNNVTETFNHALSVAAKDPLGGTVTDSATVTVKVENPNIRIAATAVTATVIKGDDVTFSIAVRNPSNLIPLQDVTLTSDNAPNCNHTFGTLNSNTTKNHTCTLSNASEALTVAFTATGKNASTGEIVPDTDFASFDVLALHASLTPNPTEILETGQVVHFTVEIRNDSSKDVELSRLTTDTFGNLVSLPNSDCELGEILQADGGTYACTFSTTVFGTPPTFNVTLTAEAEDDTPLTVSDQVIASISVLSVASDITVSVDADPTSVVGPGQLVTYTVRIDNISTLRDVTITQFEDSLLGALADLDGNCDMPGSGIEIAKEAAYECTFQAPFAANSGEKENHIITARGVDEDNTQVSGSAKVEIRSYRILMPLVPRDMRLTDEPNNVCGDAYPLPNFDHEYSFLAEDVTDWYTFELKKTTTVTVKVTNFVPQAGQVVVYRFDGINCNPVSEGGSRILVNNNGTLGTNKSVNLGSAASGHYLIRVINDGSTTTGQKYKLTIDVP